MTDFETIAAILEAYEPVGGSKLSVATVIRLGNHITAELIRIAEIRTAVEAAYDDMTCAEEKLHAAQAACSHLVIVKDDDEVDRCKHCDLYIITIKAPLEKPDARITVPAETA